MYIKNEKAISFVEKTSNLPSNWIKAMAIISLFTEEVPIAIAPSPSENTSLLTAE